MKYIPAELRRQVIEMAGNCCEYCRLAQRYDFATFEVDHIIAEKHRGQTILENLCLSCFECNRFKGSDIGTIDLETKDFAFLFNPRTMQWTDHFRFEKKLIVPLTAEGRVTEFLLRLNNDARLIKRRPLIEIGRYPCLTE